jgi:hypothetical protein
MLYRKYASTLRLEVARLSEVLATAHLRAYLAVRKDTSACTMYAYRPPQSRIHFLRTFTTSPWNKGLREKPSSWPANKGSPYI